MPLDCGLREHKSTSGTTENGTSDGKASPDIASSQYPELLNDAPHGRNEPLITMPMFVNIILAAAYKLFWCFFFLYAVPELFSAYKCARQVWVWETWHVHGTSMRSAGQPH
jgi:hypothetical protein